MDERDQTSVQRSGTAPPTNRTPPRATLTRLD